MIYLGNPKNLYPNIINYPEWSLFLAEFKNSFPKINSASEKTKFKDHQQLFDIIKRMLDYNPSNRIHPTNIIKDFYTNLY